MNMIKSAIFMICFLGFKVFGKGHNELNDSKLTELSGKLIYEIKNCREKYGYWDMNYIDSSGFLCPYWTESYRLKDSTLHNIRSLLESGARVDVPDCNGRLFFILEL
jgi:hypothetical protein